MTDPGTFSPPPEGYATTPTCPTCGHPLSLPVDLSDRPTELGPCIECGDELSARRDAMGLMVMGKAWTQRVDAAIAAEIAARRKCQVCRRLIRLDGDVLQVHLLGDGRRCSGSGGAPTGGVAS